MTSLSEAPVIGGRKLVALTLPPCRVAISLTGARPSPKWRRRSSRSGWVRSLANRSNIVSSVVTLLGFNLGIELTQLLVVALVMPSLLLLVRTPAYPVVRVGVAAIGALLAAAWLAERVGILTSNPLEPVGDLLVDHPVGLAMLLASIAVVFAGLRRLSVSRAPGLSTRSTELQPDGSESRLTESHDSSAVVLPSFSASTRSPGPGS